MNAPDARCPAEVLVAYCHPDTIPAVFQQTLVGLLHADARRPSPHVVDVVSMTSSPRIASARNQLVRAFLDHPSTPAWLLMFDADMAIPADCIDRLLEAADPASRPIVSGLYFGGKIGGPQIPHAYLLNAAGDAFDPIHGIADDDGNYGWGKVVQVHGVGAGCLLMHRSALERIQDAFAHTGFPWFAEAAANGKEFGEDLVFCLRAHSLDIPIHCHTGLILGHVKPGIIDERTFAEYRGKRELGLSEEQVREDHLRRLRLAPPVPPAPAPASAPSPAPAPPAEGPSRSRMETVG